MGKLTDQYVEAHGGWHPGHSKGKNSNKKLQGKSKNFQKSQNQNSSGNSQQQHDSKGKQNSSQGDGDNRRKCFICRSPYHLAKNCRQKTTIAFMREVVSDIREQNQKPNAEEDV